MAADDRLDIFMNGLRIGEWLPRRNSFKYDENWCESEYARSLSLSMPITPANKTYQGLVVQNYFDNLLPDSDNIRRRLAVKFKAKDTTTAALLSAIGRDCVGAIQIVPHGSSIAQVQGIVGIPLTDAQIAQILRNTTSAQPIKHDFNDGLRLSIAGAQEKNALLKHNGQWYLPIGPTPTTHILKLPLGLVGNMAADMSSSIENEWLCSRIAHHFALPVALCEPWSFEDSSGEVKALVVERFDRHYDNHAGILVRLPQEDMCQVFGMNSLQKYEEDGGPTAKMVMEILRFSNNAHEDCRNFFKTLVVFWLLAATDGHAKNFSIQLLRHGRYRLAPLYDILSSYPIIGTKNNQMPRQKVKLAMAVESKNRHYHAFLLQARQWLEFGKKLGLPNYVVTEVLQTTHAEVDGVIAKVTQELPEHFPMWVAESIFMGMKKMNIKLADIQRGL
jgi:serine/threonine-protein kinase HipA